VNSADIYSIRGVFVQRYFCYSTLMWKFVLGVVGVVLVLGGAYWLLRGNNTPQGQLPDFYSTNTAASSTTQTATTSNTTPNQPTTNPNKKMTATLHTSMGDITVEFYGEQAPKTVANFVKLAQSGFYDGTKFHRVIKGFMDQAGDPLTKDDSMQARWGTGGPGYTIQDEVSPTLKNSAGTLAMANTGQPNSAGSQFFINAVDNAFLNGGYTVFGKVTAGMDVVTAINNVPTNSSDRPLTPVVIKSVTVSQ
jgi:cyclophilin family peptidyl-prolyl cis-trans isomerase